MAVMFTRFIQMFSVWFLSIENLGAAVESLTAVARDTADSYHKEVMESRALKAALSSKELRLANKA